MPDEGENPNRAIAEASFQRNGVRLPMPMSEQPKATSSDLLTGRLATIGPTVAKGR